MKNIINYFYNLQPDNIHQHERQLKFNVNNNSYIFLPCYRSENEVKSLQLLAQTLLSKGIYCHQFVQNVNSTIITIVNNVPYVLFLVYIDKSSPVSFDDVMWFTNINFMPKEDILRKDNWYSLWTEKIDYIEYQVSQFGKTYPLLRESFSYFVGMSETSISLLKNSNINNEKTLSLSHGRVKKDTNLFDLYNPLNYIIDNKVRNVCEYFKDCFFKDIDLTEELFNYISNNSFTTNDYVLLYARMLFPTFYFDLFELIIHENIGEKRILTIIHKVNEYELFLKKLYNYLKQFVELPNIEWLNK